MHSTPLKILYVAPLGPNNSSLYRRWALERLGHSLVSLDPDSYEPSNASLRKVLFRAQAGPWVARLNREILRMAERERPQIFWADKVLALRPATLRALRRRGVVTVSYMIDNAFGPRQDPGWRLYRKNVPLFDLHVTQRDVSVTDLLERGARDVIKVQTAYEPTLHFPPSEAWSDAERTREVSFIGTPYDNRAEFLTDLSRQHGFGVSVSGSEGSWRRALSPSAFGEIFRDGELYGGRYREAIWRSKINLSFLTHSNQDEYAHKSFEIAACQGFLLAERSAGHLSKFREDEEAVFFSSPEECAEKIKRWLPDEEGRARIAAAGRMRAQTSGYGNDAQMQAIVGRLHKIVSPA